MKKGNLLAFVIISFIATLIIMTVVGIVMAPKGGGASTDYTSILTKERNDAGINLANVIANASIDPILDEDELPIMEMIKNTADNSAGLIDYIIVLDNDGTIWGDSKNPTNVSKPYDGKKIKLITSENRLIQDVDDKLFDASVPVKTGSKKIGEVHVGMRKVQIEAPKQSSSGSITPFIIMLIIGIIGIFIIVIVLSGMLNNLGSEFASSIRSSKIDELRKQEDEVQKEINAKKGEMKSIEKTMAEKNSKMKELGSRYDEIEKTIRTSDETINEKKKQVEFFENKINELASKQKDMKEDIDKAKQVDGASEELKMIKNQVDTFRMQLQQIMNDIESKRNEENSLATKLQQMKSQSAQMAANPAIAGAGSGLTAAEIEQKKKEEIEITQRKVAKRREEIALSQRIELKRKKELELTGRIELMEKKLKST